MSLKYLVLGIPASLSEAVHKLRKEESTLATIFVEAEHEKGKGRCVAYISFKDNKRYCFTKSENYYLLNPEKIAMSREGVMKKVRASQVYLEQKGLIVMVIES